MWALLAQRIDQEGIYLLPYCSMLLFGSFLFAVQRRYVHAINEYDLLSSSLAQRLNERERELQANHARLLELERAQTLTAERHRLMHDMHDGLGSALTTSLAMLEQGNVDGAELKSLLLDSVDDLRAVIDSLEPLDGDLTSVLATLRFRLGKRLELAGIGLEWDMQDLPALGWLGPPQALQLMRIVQEVLTNVLKHARATPHANLRALQRALHRSVHNGQWLRLRHSHDADRPRSASSSAARGELERQYHHRVAARERHNNSIAAACRDPRARHLLMSIAQSAMRCAWRSSTHSTGTTEPRTPRTMETTEITEGGRQVVDPNSKSMRK